MKKETLDNIYDVCIIGAGTAGMAAAYALKDCQTADGRKVRIVIIEKEKLLGGTAVNAWVQTWIEGIHPPYLENIFHEVAGVNEKQLNASLLPHSMGGGCNIVMPWQKLAKKYQHDMEKENNVTLLTEHTFIKITGMSEIEGKVMVKEILVEDVNKVRKSIKASFFVDSSASGILCRKAGAKCYVGEDPHSRFGESLMPLNDKYDSKNLIEPSLFYKILPDKKYADIDEKLLREVKTVYRDKKSGQLIKPDYIDSTGYANELFCNTMTGLGIQGYDILDREQETYIVAIKRHREHWAYVKSVLNEQYHKGKKDNDVYRGYSIGQRNWNYTGEYALMLGVRESYRIDCEYMLREIDLTLIIDPDRLKDNIACGSHMIDLHNFGTISYKDIDHINQKRVPSGIPYQCLIPKHTANVLIACRAYGASHIALSACRVNKDMAQLGWAAGFAIRQCLQKKSGNVRQVNISQIQKESGFETNVKRMMRMYKGE